MTLVFWIIEYIGCVVDSSALFCFGDLFLPSKANVRKRIISITFLSLFTIFLNQVKLISIFSTFLIVLACWVSQLLLKKKKPFLLLLVVFFYMTIIISIDFILFSILNVTLGISFSDFSSELSLYRAGAILSAKAILILLCFLMKRFFDKKKIEEVKANATIVVASVSMIITSTVMYFMQLKQNDTTHQSFILCFFIIMLIMIIVIYCSAVYMVKKENTKKEILLIEQQNILLKKSLQEQEKTFDLWRKNIHDYKHKLLALEVMMKNKKYDNVLSNIEDELKIFADKAFYLNTGNNIVDIVLNSKMNIAQSYGITFTVNAKIISNLQIDDIDLSVVLGNLIDNAIEAVVKENDEKNIHIQITQFKEILAIKIINSYSGSEISLESSKENTEFHGIGLKSVKHIVEKYDGSFSIELKDKCFIALVTI